MDKKVFIFLFGYLRQANLSLDRGRWTVWPELQAYYLEHSIPPANVLRYLENRFEVSEKEYTTLAYSPPEFGFFRRLFYRFIRKRKACRVDILYICKLLKQFDRFFSSNQIEYTTDIDRVRLEITLYYSTVLKFFIPNKEVKRLMSIEHFWQHTSPLLSLKEYLPDDFWEKLK